MDFLRKSIDTTDQDLINEHQEQLEDKLKLLTQNIVNFKDDINKDNKQKNVYIITLVSCMFITIVILIYRF